MAAEFEQFRVRPGLDDRAVGEHVDPVVTLSAMIRENAAGAGTVPAAGIRSAASAQKAR
jgi:hypothetical protein